jgi:hypothetical protein
LIEDDSDQFDSDGQFKEIEKHTRQKEASASLLNLIYNILIIRYIIYNNNTGER